MHIELPLGPWRAITADEMQRIMTPLAQCCELQALALGTRRQLLGCSAIMVFACILCGAQTEPGKAWALLEAGVQQKSAGQRLVAVKVLGLIRANSHAAELAGKALKDSSASVRAAAATALGEMHASGADAELKEALEDKQLPVAMAAAHALRLLNNPACYDVYYEVLIGERKNNSSMISQQMKVLRDPKQVAQMGFSEGIGYVPFASIGWGAVQTIMKDRKSADAAKAALISAAATDPDDRVENVLIKEARSPRPVLRVAALEAIAERGDPNLRPDVEKALGDSKSEVRYTAAAVIVRLTDVAVAQGANSKSVLARFHAWAAHRCRQEKGLWPHSDEPIRFVITLM